MTDTSFVSRNARDGGLFQSDEWARLQVASGYNTYPFFGTGFEGYALRQSVPLLGDLLFFPRGPIVDASLVSDAELQQTLLSVAEAQQVSWLRVEPQSEETIARLRALFGDARVARAPHDTSPREVLRVALIDDTVSWLGRMKPKTRYNVRLAEKRGVEVRFSRRAEDMEALLSLIFTTASRKVIVPHPKNYYRNFLTAFPEALCTVALAEYEGRLLASALLVFFGDTAYYLHGGSSDTHRELMAPFLLHFRSMEEARCRGCLYYDFGGVRVHSKQGATDTHWDGITRFKTGFAPSTDTTLFPGTYDIVIAPTWYALYRKLQSLSGLWRLFRRQFLHH